MISKIKKVVFITMVIFILLSNVSFRIYDNYTCINFISENLPVYAYLVNTGKFKKFEMGLRTPTDDPIIWIYEVWDNH